VLVKVFLVEVIRGIGSMRETLRVAEVDLSIRRFLRYGLTEALPHHAMFSYAQCVRLANSSVFEQLFTQVQANCRDAGLLDGSRLIVDATHVEADAAEESARRATGHRRPRPGWWRRAGARASGARVTGPKKRTDSQAQAIQRDRDLADRSGRQAALRARPPPHLVYRAQAATDPKAR
jgi:Transposase domain (DUF772)